MAYPDDKGIVLPLSKDQESLKRKNADVIKLITDGSRLALTQQLSNYFQVFCEFENNKFLWEAIEGVFDQPTILDSIDNEYAYHAKSLMDSFSSMLSSSKMFPRKWYPIAREVFGIDPKNILTFPDFRKGLRKLCRTHRVGVWAMADIQFLFNHIINAPYCFSSVTPDLEIDEPDSCTGFTFKLAFRLNSISTKKRSCMNEKAFAIQKLSDFAANKAIILRCLKSNLSKKPGPNMNEYVTKTELGSVLSILITDFSTYQLEKKNIKESAWLEKTCTDLLESDLQTITSDFGSLTEDSLNSMSISSQRGSFTRGYRQAKHAENMTRVVSEDNRVFFKKLKADKETYSLSQNKSLLKPIKQRPNTAASEMMEGMEDASQYELKKAKKAASLLQVKLDKTSKEKEKEEMEKMMTTLKVSEHVAKYKRQYAHIYEEIDPVLGEDIVLLRKNFQNIHSLDMMGSEGSSGNHLPPLRDSVSRRVSEVSRGGHTNLDKLAISTYKKQLLEKGAHNTEQQEKYFQSIITKFDYHIDKTLKRMTSLRGTPKRHLLTEESSGGKE